MPGQVNPCPFRFGQFLGLAIFTYGAIMDSINDVCFRCEIVGSSCFWECDFVRISLISIGVYFGAHILTLIAVLCFVKEQERTFYWIDEVIASMEMTDNALILVGYCFLITILFMYPMVPAGLLCLAGIFVGITLLSQKFGEWRQKRRTQRNLRQQIVVTIITAE